MAPTPHEALVKAGGHAAGPDSLHPCNDFIVHDAVGTCYGPCENHNLRAQNWASDHSFLSLPTAGSMDARAISC